MTQPLSPAAQAVLAAYGNEIGGIDAIMGSERRALAAALRAAADQVVPEGRALMIRMPEADIDGNELGGMLLTAEPNDRIRRKILAIAAELEAPRP